MKKILCAVALLGYLSAHDGTLDTTFAGGNLILGNPIDILAVFVDHNNNLLIGGFIHGAQGNPQDAIIYRYTPTGTPDISFNGTGSVTLSGQGAVSNIFEQPNGQIVATGFNATQSAFIATRLNPDGSFDTSFNGGVVEQISFAEFPFMISYYSALQPDNKILLIGGIGSTEVSGGIIRLNTDGTLDTSFNQTGPVPGMVTTQVILNDQPAQSMGFCIAVQSDGKLVASLGASTNPSGVLVQVVLARLNTDGSFDSSFTSGAQSGIVLIPDPNTASQNFNRFRLIVQPDGKYLVVITDLNNTTYQAVTFRVNSDGSLDTTFNGTGKITVTVPGFETDGQFLALEQNGSIIVSGDLINNSTPPSGSFITRYTATGQLDTTFGTNGITTMIYSLAQRAHSVTSAVSQEGGLYVGGSFSISGGSNSTGTVIKYTLSQPVASTLVQSTTPLYGTAQGVSLVQVFSADPAQLCSVMTNGQTWNCPSSLTGALSFQAIAHYAGGNVNIPSCFLPQSILSAAVRSKYCPC